MAILGIIGGIIYVIGIIASIVFWIMTLIKQFKSGDTLWGVLSIFIQILAPIWCFMNGHKGLGMKFVYAIIAMVVGAILAGIGGASMQEFQIPQ